MATMLTKWKATFICDNIKDVGIMEGAVEGTAYLLSVEPYNELIKSDKANGVRHYRNGQRKKDISGDDCVIAGINSKANKMIDSKGLKLFGIKHNFAEGSLPSIASRMVKEGKIIRLDTGEFTFLKKK